ncbi:Holliday junction branch migration protein RuvA [Candidatus Pantoea edessiphila]|uniref:Holliday junction branch migration complex subunit RuvA n=1 Tax=Candidatus Pantoea edessiphila TaxID=2044610 RepID=A0A2P5SYL3_9GAMM|nr:Holliday junction branch migration protein RuvA [Candidatus Pantoea edessiphila]MBK4775442.1 Holliday junction branch migration protein RuvA [Pantoea sp. Edef]PPI87429.1 Holliday junction branch migration protein RuvA [Candidatus Pantoea edessiphila]
MIGQLKGNILDKHPPIVLIEVYGIGYEINMPITCFYKLPALNNEVIIFTHFIVQKDMQLLFGFTSKKERALFRELIKLNGVGPKLALSILSSMSSKEFILAIEKEEINTLIKLPGIGKKTAKHLIIEMKDILQKIQNDLFKDNMKFNKIDSTILSHISHVEAEAITALIALGYKSQDAKNMIIKLDKSNETSCETLIKSALRNIL